MSQKNSCRLAIIGAGDIVKTIHLPILTNIASIESITLIDKSFQQAQKLSALYKLTSLENISQLSETQVNSIAICTPYGTRESIIKEIPRDVWDRVRESGFLFLEKPAILNQSDYIRYQKMGIRVGVGFMRRYYSNTNQLKAWINQHPLSQIKKITLREGYKSMASGLSEVNYRLDAKLSGGGVLAETGCHSIDQLVHILPDFTYQITDVDFIMDNEMDVDTQINATLKAENVSIQLSCHYTRLNAMEPIIQIDYDDYSISCSVSAMNPVVIHGRSHRFILQPDNRFALNANQAFFLEWNSLLDDAPLHPEISIRIENTSLGGLFIGDVYKYTNKKVKSL